MVMPPAATMVKAQPLPPIKGNTVKDLIQSDIYAVSSYNELMLRHNSLVDWLTQKYDIKK